jgi:hypothetical protein
MGELDTEEVDRNQTLRQLVEHLDELLAGSRELIARCRPGLEDGALAAGQLLGLAQPTAPPGMGSSS